MKSVIIIPAQLKGSIKVPASKSLCHRAVICASLAEGESNIENVILSDDINATCRGMESLGAKIYKNCNDINNIKLKISRGKIKLFKNHIDCGESGSTIRFLIPIALLSGGKVTFNGKGKLVTRPLQPYYDIFDKQGINYSLKDKGLPLTVEGKLKSGIFEIEGNISSQFITGLLFTLPLLDGDSKIVITTDLESKSYVDLTLDVLGKFGIEVKNNDYKKFTIKGNQKYKNTSYRVEGDFSQAAFWITAGILGGEIQCEDISRDSLQGDKVILDIVKNMGAIPLIDENFLKVEKAKTHGTVIDASNCPDIVPIAAVLGALSSGTTKIINAARLRIKESDRLKAISTELNKLGAQIEEMEDGLVIKGKEKLKGGMVDSWNDHRIAMALAIASIKCTEPVIITSSDAVKKSYPDFWRDFEKLGGKVNEWRMG